MAKRTGPAESASPVPRSTEVEVSTHPAKTAKHIDVEDLRFNYDPAHPREPFKADGVEAAFPSESERIPTMVP